MKTGFGFVPAVKCLIGLMVSLIAAVSCTDNQENEHPTVVVSLSEKLVLYPGNTTSFIFRVGPATAKVTLDMLYMAADDGSPELKPAENYRISKIEEFKSQGGAVIQGQYVAYLQDAGVSQEYSEKARLVIKTKDALVSTDVMDIVCRPPGVVMEKYSLNGYGGKIDGGNITVKVSYGTDLTNMVATFELVNAKAYVSGREQVSGVTANDFSAPVGYKVVNKDGEEFTFHVSVCFSQLPAVFIKTSNNVAINNKDVWIPNTRMYVTNAADEDWNIAYEKMNIRGRGNYTWNLAKKPYAVKLDKREKVLGMPKHKRWILLANYLDRTCMRNAVAFEIARKTGMEWVPRGESVDLVVNGKYLGNYYLCEQIRVDKNRIDIPEMTAADVTPETITGGYLLELDTYYDEVNRFRSNHGTYAGKKGLPVNIKAPDDDVLVPAQFDYIKDYFCTAEDALYRTDFASDRKYMEYIDVNSFIDWWFVHELTQNAEPKHPKSSYVHKDRNGKLTAGPVWDFDWETFTASLSGGYCVKNVFWFPQFFKDPAFVATVKQRWAAQKPGFEQVLTFIDDKKTEIKESAGNNILLWPSMPNHPNQDAALSFDDAVSRLRTVYAERIQWLDSEINAL